jgi:hypothetical protein
MQKTKKRAKGQTSTAKSETTSTTKSDTTSTPEPAQPAEPQVYDSIGQAAAALGIPKRVLQKLKRDGAPGFHGSRVYPAELQPWLEAKNNEAAGGGVDRDALECRRLLGQCKRIEHANAVDSGGVIALAPVLAAIAGIGEQLKSQLRAIYEDELPPVIAGLSAEAIRIETRKANDRLCTRFYEAANKIAKV